MLNAVLEIEQINEMRKMQEELDSDIRGTHNIDIRDWNEHMGNVHLIALQQEVREVTNECHDLWKYWKKKPVNKDAIIEESIDVIHFSMLIANKYNITTDEIQSAMIRGCSQFLEEVGEQKLIIDLLYTKSVIRVIEHLFTLLSYYGFTRDDIISEYENKNKVNYERIKTGY